ncbi:hypothetical protein LINPERHAP1_LOCUS31662, partial [Linum perenne]
QLFPVSIAAFTKSSQQTVPPDNTSGRTPIISNASCRSLAEFISSSHDTSSFEKPTISLTFSSRSFITSSQSSISFSPVLPSLWLNCALDPFFTLRNCCSCSINPVYTSIGRIMDNSSSRPSVSVVGLLLLLLLPASCLAVPAEAVDTRAAVDDRP